MRAVKKLLLTVCVCVAVVYSAFIPGGNTTVIDMSASANANDTQDQSLEKITDTLVKEETQHSKEESDREDTYSQNQKDLYTNTYKVVNMVVQNQQTQVADKGIQVTKTSNQDKPVQNIEQLQVKTEPKQEIEKVQNVPEVTTIYQEEKLSKLGEDILKGLSSYEESFNVQYIKQDEVMEQVEIIRRTRPIIGYNVKSYSLSFTTSSSGVSSSMRVNYRNTKENMDELESKLRSILTEIIQPEMTTSDKVKEIHDYVINNTQYDTTYTIHDPYNTFMSHTGVCEGYALLTQEMLNLSNIESMVVNGTGNGESHAWNLVKIEGKWRHIDTTWDDPITNTGEDILRYDYFNKTDEELSVDHVWDRSKYPKAE